MASSAGKLFRPEHVEEITSRSRDELAADSRRTCGKRFRCVYFRHRKRRRCGYQTHVAPFWRLAARYDEFQMMTSAAISSMHKIMRRPMRFIVDPAVVL